MAIITVAKITRLTTIIIHKKGDNFITYELKIVTKEEDNNTSNRWNFQRNEEKTDIKVTTISERNHRKNEDNILSYEIKFYSKSTTQHYRS